MDLFTQSVDSSLWASRTYDDPAYDDDPAAAAESAAAFSIDAPTPPTTAPQALIVAVGAAATAVVTALCPPESRTPLATLRGPGASDTPLTLATTGPLAGCALAPLRTPVAEHRAVAWARAALSASASGRVIAATSVPRAAHRGDEGDGQRVRALVSTAAPAGVADGLSPLREPDFVAGCAAAVVAEAECKELPAVCLVEVLERANFDAQEVEELANALCTVLARLGGVGGQVDQAVRDRARKEAAKSAVAAHDSIYM